MRSALFDKTKPICVAAGGYGSAHQSPTAFCTRSSRVTVQRRGIGGSHLLSTSNYRTFSDILSQTRPWWIAAYLDEWILPADITHATLNVFHTLWWFGECDIVFCARLWHVYINCYYPAPKNIKVNSDLVHCGEWYVFCVREISKIITESYAMRIRFDEKSRVNPTTVRRERW